MWNFECFQNFKFEKIFLENENRFQKIGASFLVERTNIEKVSFLYKFTLSEANVKTNKIVLRQIE